MMMSVMVVRMMSVRSVGAGGISTGYRPPGASAAGCPRGSSVVDPVAARPDLPVIDLDVVFPGFEAVDPPQGVGQRGSQARDFVVLVVDPFLEVGNSVPQSLVFVLDHVI